jgi:hypothetical protein
MLIVIFFVFTVFTFLVIVPINTVGVHHLTGLDSVTWSNLDGKENVRRFAAHIVMVYLLTC